MDVFEEIHNQQKLEEHIDGFFRDLEAMWGASGAIYVDPLEPPAAPPPSPVQNTEPCLSAFQPYNGTLTLPQIPTIRYLAPASNSYARQIWDACGFRVGKPGERESTIDFGLNKWAQQHQITHINGEGHSVVTWSCNGTQITGKWSAFRLWFFCACTKVEPTQSM